MYSTYNPSTMEAKAGNFGASYQPELNSRSGASVSYKVKPLSQQIDPSNNKASSGHWEEPKLLQNKSTENSYSQYFSHFSKKTIRNPASLLQYVNKTELHHSQGFKGKTEVTDKLYYILGKTKGFEDDSSSNLYYPHNQSY